MKSYQERTKRLTKSIRMPSFSASAAAALVSRVVIGEDPYAILGVGQDVGTDEIRSAYRRLARQHHPDLVGGSAERMAALNRAYALLGNPERRRQYDAARVQGLPIPRPAAAPPEPDDHAVWEADLDEHAADWRNMYEEERQLWEQLLASKAADDPGRAGIDQALQRTRREQLELENALRRREGLAPIDETEFEAQRVRHSLTATAHARAGCLGVLCLAAALAARRWCIGPRVSGTLE